MTDVRFPIGHPLSRVRPVRSVDEILHALTAMQRDTRRYRLIVAAWLPAHEIREYDEPNERVIRMGTRAWEQVQALFPPTDPLTLAPGHVLTFVPYGIPVEHEEHEPAED